jgi:hypothetical protein
MARRALHEFEKSAQLFLVRDTLPGHGWAACRAPVHQSASERTSDTVDGSCLKGLFAGLCLETSATLVVYGIWHAWQLLR